MRASARPTPAVFAAAIALLLLQQRPASHDAITAGTLPLRLAAAERQVHNDRAVQRPQDRLEPDTNRPGGDYKDYDVRDGPEECRADCARDPNCGSFTFVKPGIRGRFGHCFLKRGAPKPVADRCCVSGVKISR